MMMRLVAGIVEILPAIGVFAGASTEVLREHGRGHLRGPSSEARGNHA